MPRDLIKETEADSETRVRERAAEIIEQDGWWYGQMPASGHCFITAVNVALSQLGLFAERGNLLDKIIGPTAEDRSEKMKWNDAPGRTKKEVLARLRTGRTL